MQDPGKAKLQVEKVMRQKNLSQALIDEEILQLQIEREKAKLVEEEEPVEEVKETPFRNLVETGKYLHENDLKWCKKNTKFAEKEVIKWFRRFRALCPRGNMTRDKLDIVYHKLFIGGEPDYFSETILDRFIVDDKKYLDFKVGLKAFKNQHTHCQQYIFLEGLLNGNSLMATGLKM